MTNLIPRKTVKSMRSTPIDVRKKSINYAIAACLIILVCSVLYGIIKLYVFFQRLDASVIVINVVVFVLVSGILLILLKKRSDADESEVMND
jgi:drug/metabolite transporter (DMT)-like permease